MVARNLADPLFWAHHFGFARTALFAKDEASHAGEHSVLLDGGPGSFVLSATDERIWEDRIAADWSWSSNVPHHVTVTGNEVAVVRWDKAKRERLKRASVARQLNDFYRYLAADRVQSNQDVTNYMLRLFRRVRSLVAAAEMDDDQSIDAFLEFLACVIKQSGRSDKVIHGGVSLQTGGEDLLRSLSAPGVDKLLSEVISRPSSGSQPALIPSLAIRHAGSEIFQEAHFELLRASIPDLFGYTGPSRAKQVTRGGTHYTPPLLARTIAEQAFAQIPNLADRDRLTILDPACGSGSFLQEALRALRRCGFHGRLFLIGRDTSGPAISMARFVLTAATKDWSPGGGCETDIQQADSLAEALPPADVVVMNPPFVAWTALTMKQREQMRGILGSLQKGRSDLSMAFVSRALECLAPGGVLGTLLPASLLTLEAAEAWRRHLLDQGELAFIAALGDYGLFKYAQVQVAAAVFVVPHAGRGPREPVTALVATNDSGATGDALRALRVSATGRLGSDQMLPDKGWRLFQTSSGGFRRRGTWRLTPPQTEAALQDLLAIGRAVRIGDLFQVRQGVRTGLNTAFVLAAGEVAKLPRVEREWFRPAVMNVSIKDGQIEGRHRVFYPYDLRGLAIRDETQLRNVVPVYFEHYLRPFRSKLKRRASIVRSNRSQWWGLSERRAWALDPSPRVVSKYFGGPGGFAADLEARYIVVQGFAWLPKWPPSTMETMELPVQDILAAYVALMNSTSFARLLEIYSPHVAGGQFDLSARHVKSIPIPNLPSLASGESAGAVIAKLVKLGNNARCDDHEWQSKADELTRELIGNDIFA